MNKIQSVIVCLVAGFCFVVAADQFSADQSFGASMPADGKAISLAQAIEGIEGLAGPDDAVQMQKISGLVTEVCQAKGCWMILVDPDNNQTYARITFEDYGFFVPTQTSMQQSVIYGVLSESTLTGAEAAHFAADAGAQSTLELEGVVREYSIIARSVQLQDQS